ncbi:hypothetical protein DPMN_142023 [Dreissena polymorpha]|uniref:DSBA-like thioredoxin domain-containing protein n=1 Tax=Dreissena polymorpha TaxID=45954 RepID=A0A9D4JN39_DREPO|nr:hypothetical protein DPMN_142023 [Dreissena polymorpha]
MEEAMTSLSSKFEFRVRWEPYFLKPDAPPGGTPIPPEYADPRNPRTQHLWEVGSSLGIEFKKDRKKFANTAMGHALLEYAKVVNGGEKQDLVAEKLFKRCFTNGEDLLLQSCLDVASEVGFNQDEVRVYLQNPQSQEKVMEKARAWAAKGISGVPTFYMNGHKMFSGAQDPPVFERMFEIASERLPTDTPSSKT